MAAILATGDCETVTRWPQGREGAAMAVTAIWEPSRPEWVGDSENERTTTSGQLYVSATTETHGDDVWVIDGECYATAGEPKTHAGMTTVSVRRVDRVATARHRPGEMY